MKRYVLISILFLFVACAISQVVMLQRRPSAVVAPGFSPADVSGLAIWLDANAIGGLSDGDDTGTWQDSTVNNNDFFPMLSSPTYETGELGGKPCVRFTSANSDALTNASAVSVFGGTDNDFTMMFVAELENVTTTYTLFGAAGSSGSPSTAYIAFNSINAGKFFLDRSDDVPNRAFETINAATTNTWRFYTFRFDGTTMKVYTNMASCSDDVALDVGAITLHRLCVGALPRVFNNYLNGDVAEVIIYDSDIALSDMTNVWLYITNKYGALPW